MAIQLVRKIAIGEAILLTYVGDGTINCVIAADGSTADLIHSDLFIALSAPLDLPGGVHLPIGAEICFLGLGFHEPGIRIYHPPRVPNGDDFTDYDLPLGCEIQGTTTADDAAIWNYEGQLFLDHSPEVLGR